MISVPGRVLAVLALAFSAYHVLLGVVALRQFDVATPAVIALGLYVVATVGSLWPTGTTRMSPGLASFNLAVAIALPLLVTSELSVKSSYGYATWYVAAVGTLMTITAARRRLSFAWVGTGALVLHTVLWAGPFALVTFGVVGSVMWVAIAHALTAALSGAARETRRYVRAEREAADWQASQDAQLFEGRIRIAQMSRVTAPMLRTIINTGGDLTVRQRDECRLLEATVRDEIRGRMLLNNAVRAAVRGARQRGAHVSLLDEGGIDDLDELARDRVLSQVAEAVAGSAADRFIVRTATNSDAVAVTVVGLRAPIGQADAATADDDDDADVDLWLTIER